MYIIKHIGKRRLCKMPLSSFVLNHYSLLLLYENKTQMIHNKITVCYRVNPNLWYRITLVYTLGLEQPLNLKRLEIRG